MEIISNIALISINETLIIQLISFLIFLFILNRVMFRPLQRIMAERSEHVEQVKQEIVKSESDLQRLIDQMTEQESSVRHEAFEINRRLETTAKQEASQIFEQVRQEIDQMRIDAQKSVQSQISTAQKRLQKESGTLAVAIMEAILGRRLGR